MKEVGRAVPARGAARREGSRGICDAGLLSPPSLSIRHPVVAPPLRSCTTVASRSFRYHIESTVGQLLLLLQRAQHRCRTVRLPVVPGLTYGEWRAPVSAAQGVNDPPPPRARAPRDVTLLLYKGIFLKYLEVQRQSLTPALLRSATS